MLGIFCACKYRKGWLELTWGWLVLKVAEVGIGIRDTIGTTETAVTRYMKALRCYLLRVTLTARPSHVQKLGATARSKRVMNSVKRTAVMTQSQTERSLPPPDVSRYTHTQTRSPRGFIYEMVALSHSAPRLLRSHSCMLRRGTRDGY